MIQFLSTQGHLYHFITYALDTLILQHHFSPLTSQTCGFVKINLFFKHSFFCLQITKSLVCFRFWLIIFLYEILFIICLSNLDSFFFSNLIYNNVSQTLVFFFNTLIILYFILTVLLTFLHQNAKHIKAKILFIRISPS